MSEVFLELRLWLQAMEVETAMEEMAW